MIFSRFLILALVYTAFVTPCFAQKDWLSINDAAAKLLYEGKFDLALEQFKEANAIALKIYGKNWYSNATTLNNMAVAYQGLGKYTQAATCYLESLEISKKLSGEE